MRNFLGMLGKSIGWNNVCFEPRSSEGPSHAEFLEARMNSAFDIDAIWYYERLKWQTRD